MKKANQYLTLLTIGAVAVIILATLTTATFAWFTANREVETEKVTARSGSTNLELQLSKKNGSAFSAEMETDTDGTVYETETTYSIVKLETLGNKKLMPVGMVLGTLACYIFGTAWFMISTGSELAPALMSCVVPFLIGDAIKIAAATAICIPLKSRLDKIIARGNNQ